MFYIKLTFEFPSGVMIDDFVKADDVGTKTRFSVAEAIAFMQLQLNRPGLTAAKFVKCKD